MKKICVLGSNGMAGHVIYEYFSEKRYDVYGLARSVKNNEKVVNIDAKNKEELDNWLNQNEFDVIINCIGLLNKMAEENIDSAIYLNSFLPHYLETKYKNTKTKIIHISTDCVFSGETGGYMEDSFKDGDTIYDRTKALGEIVNNKDLTFRMSIIGPDYNEHSIGLFNWFMSQSGIIKGYDKVYWTGVTTIELAKGIEEAIKQNLTGLYHLVPENKISKYELLKLFKEVFKRDDIIIEKEIEHIMDKSLINSRTDFNYEVPDYKSMIEEMKEWVSKKNIYNYEKKGN